MSITPTALNLEQLRERIRSDSGKITAQIMAAAKENIGNEARFRTLFANIIEPWAKALDIQLLIYEERTLATGRADATYNRLIIEYEAPGRLRSDINHKPTAHAIQQARDYVDGVVQKEHQEAHRLIGVALDGVYFIYVRKVDGHWVEPEVEPVNEQSVARFLRLLVSLNSGKALIPENLVKDFGAHQVTAQSIASSLYKSLDTSLQITTPTIVHKLFEQWKLFFGQVTGYDEVSNRLREKKEMREFARGMGLDITKCSPTHLLFAVHSYYALLIKLIAYYALSRFVSGFGTRFGSLYQLPDEELKQELQDLEKGGLFRKLGIRNFLEGDFFKWYLTSWDKDIAHAVRLLLDRLKDYDPGTLEVSPEQARDLLKKLYHHLMPAEIRHDLGEYYTPDWLAEYVLNEVGYTGQIDKRLLDPACGSGTFLVLAIKRLREQCFVNGLNEQETLATILNNIVGIDLNPLAVISARTNYLLALGDLLEHRTCDIDIPVYLADSVLIPTGGEQLFTKDRYELSTVVGTFEIPSCLTRHEQIDNLANLIEECVYSETMPQAFLSRAKKSLDVDEDMWLGKKGEGEATESILKKLYEALLELHEQGLDGIWARILQNAFMPLFIGKFDFVAGNPPWVFWNNLPAQHRNKIKDVMTNRYHLIRSSASTMKQLGQAGKDISALFVYVAVDKYLNESGKLGFVITQTLFQSTASNEFRQFRISEGPPFNVRRVDDMVVVQPFSIATNKTACIFATKGPETTYPLPYYIWRHTGPFDRDDATLEEVLSNVQIETMEAVPSTSYTSFWVVRPAGASSGQSCVPQKVLDVRLGIETKLESVFSVQIVKQYSDKRVLVRNVLHRAKKPVQQVSAPLELSLLHPFVSGDTVSRWCAQPAGVYIVPHTESTGMLPMDEFTMQTCYPETYKYLHSFKQQLEQRSLHLRWGKTDRPFYSLYDIGTYTFAPWKIVWKRSTKTFEACVLTSLPLTDSVGALAVPNGNLMMIPFTEEREAHYVCAVLNSCIARAEINASICTKAHKSIIDVVHIPCYNSANELHEALAQASLDAHAACVSSQIDNIETLEDVVDHHTAELIGVTGQQLQAYRDRLPQHRIRKIARPRGTK